MLRNTMFVSLGIFITMVGLSSAHDNNGGETVRMIGAHDIIERVDGAVSSVSVVEVSLAPGESGHAHRHPGPVFVYVLEGVYELGIDDAPTKTYKAGETFYEPTKCLHRVSRNPSTDTTTRLIATVIHPRDTHDVAIPEPVTP